MASGFGSTLEVFGRGTTSRRGEGPGAGHGEVGLPSGKVFQPERAVAVVFIDLDDFHVENVIPVIEKFQAAMKQPLSLPGVTP